jgi:hypothetical protein
MLISCDEQDWDAENAHVYARRALLTTAIFASASRRPQRRRTWVWFGGIWMPPDGSAASSACCSNSVTRCPTRVSASAAVSPANPPPTMATWTGRCACEYARWRFIVREEGERRGRAVLSHRRQTVSPSTALRVRRSIADMSSEPETHLSLLLGNSRPRDHSRTWPEATAHRSGALLGRSSWLAH